MIDLTVVLATYNGERVLRRVLNGYAQQVDAPAWKFIIVDNGSTDGTASMLREFETRLPLVVIRAPDPGKNRALNEALPFIEGEGVILTDDDAIPEQSFLKFWKTALDEHPDYDLFGGAVELEFDAPPPAWLLKDRPQFGPLYAENKLPDGPIQPDQIFGPNMAVRTRVFASGVRFNEGIGPNSSDANYSMGSETEFAVRSAKMGLQVWFSASPVVRHIVRPNQVSWDFWSRRAYRHGRGIAYMHIERGEISIDRSRLLLTGSRIKHRILQVFRQIGQYSPNPRQRFQSDWQYNWHRGFWDEYMSEIRKSTSGGEFEQP